MCAKKIIHTLMCMKSIMIDVCENSYSDIECDYSYIGGGNDNEDLLLILELYLITWPSWEFQ